MNRRHGLSRWSMGLLATTMFTAAGASQALAQAASGPAQLEEIVVTAQKREENLQSVPVSIQALGTQKLQELQISDFGDYVKFLPSVSFKTSGPGFTNIYMRGVASGENANHSGPRPSVGVYLDEQPITTITGPLDVHIYDIARVESLAGPQGTLYGASSQAGTIRIITNKPSTAGVDGGYDLEVNHVTDGDWGYTAEGFANLPVSEHAAVRLVGWYQHDAGYIDNVAGTRTYPTSGITISNVGRAKDNYNDVDTYGARAALKIDLDENWTVTPTVMAQSQDANGIVAFDPLVGDLKVTHFYPETSKDKWVDAALAIQGKLANLDITYAGAYLRRNVDTQQDYSDYSYFYDTAYGGSVVDSTGNLINPSQTVQGHDRYTKQSHELRLASPADWRFRFVTGLFYEKQTHNIEQNYFIRGFDPALSVSNRPGDIWLTKQLRTDIDYAVFGEATFDITDALAVTGGVRFFKTDNSLKGFFGFGAGFSGSTGEAACFAPPIVSGGPCTNLDKTTKEDGTTYKLNATYKLTDNKMIYVTTSTGFRPGGINRRGTLAPYQSDFLTNYEFGWKTTWADSTFRWNGAVYYDTWKDFQFSFLGANGLTEIRNAAQAEMKGVETDINWRASEGLTIFGSAAYTDAKLTKPYCFDLAINPSCTGSTEAATGTQLPITPKFKGNVTARYEWDIGEYRAHMQASVVYQGSSTADLRTVESTILGRLPSYTTADLTAGVKKERWTAEAFIKNAFDARGEVTRFAECAIQVCGPQTYIVPIRPMLIGVRFGQDF
ncbi:MAG: TonB-dependent receptor [Phenylobacterium sp.]